MKIQILCKSEVYSSLIAKNKAYSKWRRGSTVKQTPHFLMKCKQLTINKYIPPLSMNLQHEGLHANIIGFQMSLKVV